MAKAGHSVQVVQQMATVDVQCNPNDPRLILVTQYIADMTMGLGSPVPLQAFADLLRTKNQRMRDKGVSEDKMQLYEYYDKITTKKITAGEVIVYDFPNMELNGYEKSSEDCTLGDTEDPVFTESQLRAMELKKEAISLRKKMATPLLKMGVEVKEVGGLDTAPLVEQGHLEGVGETKNEFHNLKGKFPEPEILRSYVFQSNGIFREHIKDRLFTFLNVFSKEECDKLRKQLDFSGEEQKVSLVIWRIIKEYLPSTLPDGRKLRGVRTKMNYYRYGPGQYFKTHIDGGYRFTSTGETSEYTFVIYLNDDFQGGTTRFCGLPEWNNEIREVVPVQGGMLVFHQHDTKHCGVTLESGYKHILQGMVMYGPLRINALGQPFGKEAQLFHICEC